MTIFQFSSNIISVMEETQPEEGANGSNVAGPSTPVAAANGPGVSSNNNATEAPKATPEKSKRIRKIFFGNNTFYVFFRLYQVCVE